MAAPAAGNDRRAGEGPGAGGHGRAAGAVKAGAGPRGRRPRRVARYRFRKFCPEPRSWRGPCRERERERERERSRPFPAPLGSRTKGPPGIIGRDGQPTMALSFPYGGALSRPAVGASCRPSPAGRRIRCSSRSTRRSSRRGRAGSEPAARCVHTVPCAGLGIGAGCVDDVHAVPRAKLGIERRGGLRFRRGRATGRGWPPWNAGPAADSGSRMRTQCVAAPSSTRTRSPVR